MFADDLLLLSISVADMQNMVNIVKTELDWLDMEINVKKSMCMRIGKRHDVAVGNICLADKPIKWVKEIKYLGLYITAAASFKCNLHYAKVKFFRSLNGILSKLGASPPVSMVLHLVATYCNPVLFYGLDALHLSKANYSSLSYPYNSVFTKLFSTFDKNIITLCQFYCGTLPSSHELDIRTLNFYEKLGAENPNPASVLFKWFGSQEYTSLLTKYEIEESSMASFYLKERIRLSFHEECELLL